MGMFDKDKEIGLILTNEFRVGEEFALFNAVVDPDPVPTDIGPARKTRLTVAKLDDSGRVSGDNYEITTLASSIADKAEQASEDDFPAVVKWLTVRSTTYNVDATVLQFVRPLNQ